MSYVDLCVICYMLYVICYIMTYVDLFVICGGGKAQFDVRNQGQEEEDSM